MTDRPMLSWAEKANLAETDALIAGIRAADATGAVRERYLADQRMAAHRAEWCRARIEP